MKKLGVMTFLQQFAKKKHFKPVFTILLSVVVFANCKKDFLADPSSKATTQTSTDYVSPTDLEQSIYTTLLDFGKYQDKRSVNAKWFLTKGNTVHGISDEVAEKIRAKTVEQARLINQLGNEGYYDYLRQGNILPVSVVDYAEKMNGIIRVTIGKGQTSFSNIEMAIKQIEEEVRVDKSLKQSDLQLIQIVAASAKASYHFLSENALAFAVGGIQSRDACSPLYWGGAGVGAGLVTAGLIHYEVITVAAAVPVIGAVAFGVVGIYALICNWDSVWNWVTGGSSGTACSAPPSIVVSLIDCETAELSAYGGQDILAYDWSLSTGITFDGPAVTTSNSIRGRTNFPSSFTNAKVFAKCKNGEEFTQTRDFKFIDLTSADAPSIGVADGLATCAVNQRVRFSATSASRGVNILSWEIRRASSTTSYGGSIVAQSSYWAEANFFLAGDYIIVAKMTNRCNGRVSEGRWQISVR